MVQNETADPGRAGTVELYRGNLATIGGKEVDTDDRSITSVPVDLRAATLDDVEGIRSVFHSEYGEHYDHPQYTDTDALARLVYADGALLLVAVTDTNRGRYGLGRIRRGCSQRSGGGVRSLGCIPR